MRFDHWRSYFAGVALLAVFASSAHAQSAIFSVPTDAVPGRFFNGPASAADPADPNRLIIAFNSGTDLRTWQATDFRAATSAFSPRAAMDTLQFDVVAPEGHYIESITYTQRGAGSVVRSGGVHGASSWIVGNSPLQLGFFGSNPTLTGTVDLSEMKWTVVPVSITSSLFAFAPPVLGSASISITAAEVVVVLKPIE
jgi:hypothetical protein